MSRLCRHVGEEASRPFEKEIANNVVLGRTIAPSFTDSGEKKQGPGVLDEERTSSVGSFVP